jgi:hypothetical protein
MGFRRLHDHVELEFVGQNQARLARHAHQLVEKRFAFLLRKGQRPPFA